MQSSSAGSTGRGLSLYHGGDGGESVDSVARIILSNLLNKIITYEKYFIS